MNRIDEKTSVPLGWVLGWLGTIALILFWGATFVADTRHDVRDLKGDMVLVKRALKIPVAPEAAADPMPWEAEAAAPALPNTPGRR